MPAFSTALERPLVAPLDGPFSESGLPWDSEEGGAPPFNILTLAWRFFLRADIVTLNGADVDSWDDQGAFNQDFAFNTARPLWIASDAGLGNQPAVQSDGVSERLQRATLSMGGSVGAFTWWMVGRHDVVGNNAVIANYEPAATSVRCRSLTGGQFNALMTGFSLNSTSLWRPNNRSLIYWWNGATQRVYVNGVQEGGDQANATTAFQDNAPCSIFATTSGLVPIAATIGEIGILPYAASPAEIASMHSAAVKRYALA